MDAGSEAHLSHKVLDAEHQGQIDLLLQVEKESAATRTLPGSPSCWTASSSSPTFIS